MAIQEIVVQGFPEDREDLVYVLQQVKESGATAVQIYTFWKDFEPNAEGEFEWEYFDTRVRAIQEAGLKWVPFLLVGPKYAAPTWWLNDPRHRGLVCLEHGKETPIESIWNPAFREQVSRVVKAFAEHYGPWNVIQSIQPGICGDYGESIMPCHGNWPGDYHSHMGYWCGDEYAVADFRRAMQKKYGSLDALNTAWRTRYVGFEEITPFRQHQAPSRTALFDMLWWYRDSMTEFVDFWLAECRAALPDTPIYMCTGGYEHPAQASDFAAQAKVCAKYNAGIRLTNEASSFFSNYVGTALGHAACEQYGAYLGLEPAGEVTLDGIQVRMFGSAVYGNRQMMYYYYNLFRTPSVTGDPIHNERTARFTEHIPLLHEKKTTSDVAFFWPSLVGMVSGGNGLPVGISPIATLLRRLTVAKPVNERMIADGALSEFKLLIMPPAEFTDRATLHAITEFVKGGGKVLALGCTADIELQPVEEYDALFGILPDTEWGEGGANYIVKDTRFARFAAIKGYHCWRGAFRLHPETIELSSCEYRKGYSGTHTEPMANVFMREYPSGGVAIMYAGPHDFAYDPQAEPAAQPPFIGLLQDVLDTYAPAPELRARPGEQARGYIGEELYALLENNEIQKVE